MSNGIVNEEVWRAVPIEGLEDNYEVSTLGRIRRSAGGRGARAGRIINAGITAGGYCLVDLCTGGVEKCSYLHRLVAVAFLANPEGKPQVNHLSGVKSDNSVMNLDWATRKENAAHAASMGLIVHGERHYYAKLTSGQVAQIRSEMAGEKGHKRADKVRELAARYGVSRSTIRSVASGRTWKHCLPKRQDETLKATGGQLEQLEGVDGQVGACIVTPGNGQPSEAMAA